MRHNVCGRKLNRTKSHRDALFANMATSLFEHKKLHTTEAKAKELRPFAESLITKAKIALLKEKQKLLPEGQTIDIHSRRLVAKHIRNKGVIQELFDAIAPTVEARNGGYCRIIKTGTRRGDAARTAIIELVDWSAPVDGATSLKRKKKQTTSKPKTSKAKEPVAKQTPPVAAPQDAKVEDANLEKVATEEVVSPVVAEATTATETPEVATAEANTEATTNVAETTENTVEPTVNAANTEEDNEKA